MSSGSLILSSASSSMLLNTASVHFSSVIVFFKPVMFVFYFLLLSITLFKVLTVFIHSSPVFGEHFNDH